MSAQAIDRTSTTNFSAGNDARLGHRTGVAEAGGFEDQPNWFIVL
jgi:hypothetical protein